MKSLIATLFLLIFLATTIMYYLNPRSAGIDIFTPIINDDLEEVKRVIKQDPGTVRLNAAVYNDTPLHTAVEHSRLKIIEYLIEKGAKINAPDKEGFSPLQLAVIMNQYDAAKLLLKLGANIDHKDSHGINALTYSVRVQNKRMFNLLLKNGANHENIEIEFGEDPQGFKHLLNHHVKTKT